MAMCYHLKGPYGVVTVRFFFVPWIQQKPRAWSKVARLLAGGGADSGGGAPVSASGVQRGARAGGGGGGSVFVSTSTDDVPLL